VQQSSYSEINLSRKKEKTGWIIGANLLTDKLKEKPLSTVMLRNYQHTTLGGFIQNTWTPNKKFSFETGIRLDFVKPYGAVFLPRVSMLYKMNKDMSLRLGGGWGYKTPTVFNEESEKIQLKNVLPINEGITTYEKSTGVNFDINYRKRLGSIGITINQLFFYTQLNNPLLLQPINQELMFKNANGHIDTKGMETNIRLSYGDFKLFLGYTYADVMTHFNNTKKWLPLTPKHRLNNVLMYEKEDKIKIGIEAYYYNKQLLSDGTMGISYWICGAMAEKPWEHFSVFVNFENFLDVRQTRFDTIYAGPISNPVFRDIYAPVDGFVINGGVKIKW
jgi:iron complex outermembrane receptor protein